MDDDTTRPEPNHESVADQLPFLDEHSRLISAPIAEVWRVLSTYLAAWNRPPTNAYASVVGARPRRAAGAFPGLGSTVPGFAVSQVDPPGRLALTGKHHFSRYTLTFLLEPLDTGTLVRARSHAEFPGLHGRAYRAAVIGSRAHRTLIQRLLRSVERRACRE